MKKVTALKWEFNLRETREECLEVWEGDPKHCPERLYTLAETDGGDGLSWVSLEEFRRHHHAVA